MVRTPLNNVEVFSETVVSSLNKFNPWSGHSQPFFFFSFTLATSDQFVFCLYCLLPNTEVTPWESVENQGMLLL